jgi:4-carboxymuconolactone decarboxylase
VSWAQRSGFAATTDGERLIGPFNPSLLSPEMATQSLKLQATEEQYTSLDERARQIVILTVGAVWQAPYELYAHAAAAHHAGLAESTVAELIAGGEPDALTDPEKTAHRLARALSTASRRPRSLPSRRGNIRRRRHFGDRRTDGYLSHGMRHPQRL